MNATAFANTDTADPPDVLVLTRHLVLAMDLQQALSAAGMRARNTAMRDAQFQAVIVDADRLDSRDAVLVRHYLRRNVPVVLISDKPNHIGAVRIEAAAWFNKPLSSDALTLHLARLVRSAVAGE